ncbi:MAG: C4-dicarboxylate ABC transporter substrate-binding protein [Salinicola sp.]|uniref:TAXI family TRAP transporter solute-binding subunit n=1 Tax=uncultured Salinicola sp. TaxID=1193542 RepID=UPI000C954E6A|nr:TAXI family TRAP transporter solute-binding subunit [uncultured Salinicola sp.]MAM58755.1 C4-dicarboxylate ABC transporter substrate-binding protein [Salinicola sp.]
MSTKRFQFGCLALVSLLWSVPVWAGSPIVIGTGGASGVYLPTGTAICQLYQQATGATCRALPTGGSFYNANSVRNGDLAFGIVQSDVQYAAFEGTAQFYDNGPSPDLRTLFSLHAEAFTVVAKPADIREFDDLLGKRVNVGNPGSGHRATLNALLAVKGKTEGAFALASELKPEDMTRVMCSGKLDAFFYVVGHPSQAIEEATRRCGAHLVDVSGPDVAHLIEAAPYYSVTVIPGGTYANTPDDTTTFGVRATLMTRADVDDDDVYRLVKAVFENLEALRRSHPSLATLTAAKMAREGMTAPLHPGARRYYEEVGLLPIEE